MFESALFPNLLYLVLVAGIWIAALAVVSPGTGVLELLALVALGSAGLGTLVAPLNAWALLLLTAGAVFFVLSLRFIKPEIGLLLSALAFSCVLFAALSWMWAYNQRRERCPVRP